MKPRALTALAHELLGPHLRPGDLAVDATVGNGHDTLFMAARVVPGGHVYGFDIQPGALAVARGRLSAAGFAGQVTLCERGHEDMAGVLPRAWHGRVAAVTFNLGYLPGSDKTVITRPTTTLAALDQGLSLLRPGGMISLLVYRGHAGADAESGAVADWIAGRGRQANVRRYDSPGPLLYTVQNGA